MPARIRARHHRGWRLPPDTIMVCRPSKWSNPYRVDGRTIPDAHTAVVLFADLISRLTAGDDLTGLPSYPSIDEIRTELAGKNVACSCREERPCHGDVLLVAANPNDDILISLAGLPPHVGYRRNGPNASDLTCGYTGLTPFGPVCGALGAVHLLWRGVTEHSAVACHAHARSARRFGAVDEHRIADTCGLPDAVWIDGAPSCCAVPTAREQAPAQEEAAP